MFKNKYNIYSDKYKLIDITITCSIIILFIIISIFLIFNDCYDNNTNTNYDHCDYYIWWIYLIILVMLVIPLYALYLLHIEIKTYQYINGHWIYVKNTIYGNCCLLYKKNELNIVNNHK